MLFGSGIYTYTVVEGWGQAPAGWCGSVPAVACDSLDRVFVYTRGAHPLMIFDRTGTFIDSWGEGILWEDGGHGISIDPDDNVYCTDYSAHCIFKFNRHGELIMTLGIPGQIGANDGDPFNIPTDVGIASTGELFISDGYGNRRVHKFSAAGTLLLSWGTAGPGPGQFDNPHCVRVDKYDRVWVCDRENNRIQIFDTQGTYLDEWTGFHYPATIFFDPTDDIVYIAELEYRLSIYTLDRELLAEWGGGESSDTPGEFRGYPHGLWVDSRGDIYVGQYFEDGTTGQFFVNKQLQKFARQAQ